MPSGEGGGPHIIKSGRDVLRNVLGCKTIPGKIYYKDGYYNIKGYNFNFCFTLKESINLISINFER